MYGFEIDHKEPNYKSKHLYCDDIVERKHWLEKLAYFQKYKSLMISGVKFMICIQLWIG